MLYMAILLVMRPPIMRKRNLFESLEEMEAQTIGNLLPNDDELLSGGWEKMASPPGQRDSEFTGGNINSQSGGSVSSVVGEHPSRTLFVRNINTNVEDSELEALFEQYGDIRTLYTTCKHRGFVMISYYDIRAARNAIRALQDKPLRRRKLDIHFSIPKDNPSEKDINQGTLAAFNLDSYVSNEVLHQIFGVYGEVKEISEVPQRSHGKFIEFYDVRAAEAALRALNMSDIAGKKIKIEPSCPGGARECLLPPFPPDSERDECGPYLQQSSPPSNSTTGFTVSHGGITSAKMDNGTIPECGHSKGQLRVEFHGSLNFHPHSFPEYHDGYTNGAPGNSLDMAVNLNARPSDRIENRQFCRLSSNGQTLELNDAVFGFSGNVNVPSPGHHYMWSSSPQPQSQGLMWPNSPTFVNGVCNPTPWLHAFPRAPSHMRNTFLPINSQRVDWHHLQILLSGTDDTPRAGESPNASGFHPGSLGNMRISEGGQMIPLMSPFDSPNGRARSRINDGSANQADNKKQFELDIDRIMRGDNNRTTLMIKNIPNKYTSKLLLAAIDERHKGTYDFIYLPKGKFFVFFPQRNTSEWKGFLFFGLVEEGGAVGTCGTQLMISFISLLLQNRCNVGYAFINMTDPSLIIPLYKAFNGKKVGKIQQRKGCVTCLWSYTGKSCSHCPIFLFNPDGPNAGDQHARMQQAPT
ncbi:MEI2-like protein 5 [Actinidia rufa]|uniref:MEI2-like protein 5 n=1 Tax=Actinidia rufa TaxID=165716 RepID=A0A7J0EYT5_9ERIC|nr:MEI2-like protein 5 [Actinidia rufa]